MKKLYIVMILLFFAGIHVFGADGSREEIGFLLFTLNSDNEFADPAQASIYLDSVANYLKGKNVLPGQIYVYGYAANANNDIDPVYLSRNRAFFVIQELQKRGIAGSLFADPVGYGSVDLWGSNIDESDKIPNRRVRILLGDSILTPEAVTAEPAETVEPAILKPAEKPAEKPRKSFPLRLFLLLLLIIPFIIIAATRKKNASDKPAPIVQKTEPPKEHIPVNQPPVFEQKPEPPKEDISAKPSPVFEQKTEPPKENVTIKPIPVAAQEPEPPKEKLKILTEEEIRLYAYGLFERRFWQNGNDVLDWYQSISELTARYEALGYRVKLYWE